MDDTIDTADSDGPTPADSVDAVEAGDVAIESVQLLHVTVAPTDFDSWYARTAPRLVGSLSLVIGDTHTAADVTAEAMARALERWSRVRSMDAPEGWVYRVALNLWKRQQRRATLGRMLLRRTMPPSEEAAPVGLPVELRAVIAALPARQREVLVLRLVLGLSQTETAALTGLAEGTIASTLSDAKRSIRTALQSDNPEVTP